MKRELLEEHLGQTVKVVLAGDNKVLVGELHKTGEEIFKRDPNLYLPQKYYVLINHGDDNMIFRTSHVKSCEVEE